MQFSRCWTTLRAARRAAAASTRAASSYASSLRLPQIAARSDGLFAYSPTARGDSYLLAGAKSHVLAFHEAVAVATADAKSQVAVYNLANSCEELAMEVLR